MKIHVHDYLIDYLGADKTSPDPWCDIFVMYSFNEEEDDANEYLKSFSVYAGTPKGLAIYMKILQDEKMLPSISFFRPLVVVSKFDERDIFQFIKNHLESLTGSNEQELILKAMMNLDWVHDSPQIDDEINYLLR